MTLFVLSHYSPEGRLIGIFSTEDKAKIAAEEYMKFISPNTKIEVEEAEGETLYADGKVCIHITEWVVDRALVGGEWTILRGSQGWD